MDSLSDTFNFSQYRVKLGLLLDFRFYIDYVNIFMVYFEFSILFYLKSRVRDFSSFKSLSSVREYLKIICVDLNNFFA